MRLLKGKAVLDWRWVNHLEKVGVSLDLRETNGIELVKEVQALNVNQRKKAIIEC